MDAAQTARLFYRLFNERRLDEASELVDPQAIFHYVPSRQRLIGRAGYRALAAAWLQAFADARLELTVVRAIDEETIDVEFIGHGTHTGELVLGETVTVPATGRAAHLPFHERLVVRHGLVVSSELTFDLDELKKRLFG